MGPISIIQMKRVIYSVYVDIPTHELDNQNPYFWDTISKSERTKIALKENYQRLLHVKEKYSEQIGVDFKFYQYKFTANTDTGKKTVFKSLCISKLIFAMSSGGTIHISGPHIHCMELYWGKNINIYFLVCEIFISFTTLCNLHHLTCTFLFF